MMKKYIFPMSNVIKFNSNGIDYYSELKDGVELFEKKRKYQNVILYEIEDGLYIKDNSKLHKVCMIDSKLANMCREYYD